MYNKFDFGKIKIGDDMISKHHYAFIPFGTRVRVSAITNTGSLKFQGIQGTYLRKNFALAPDQDQDQDSDSKDASKEMYIGLAFDSEYYNDGKPLDDLLEHKPCDLCYGTKEEVTKYIHDLLKGEPSEIWVICLAKELITSKVITCSKLL